ncbi:hypothetical protein GGS26DRAFT_107661 [Hypomontagnella submonticulosa]|nr:hypothetical protein GGS26DRAFT_107661 [Hypomontagnella submonticulosa]
MPNILLSTIRSGYSNRHSVKRDSVDDYKRASCDHSYNEEKGKRTPCTESLGFPFKVEGSLGWAGNHPCVYGPTEGCAQHNPHKLPIAYNKRIPSSKKKPSIIARFIRPPEIPEYDEIQPSNRIWSTLHLDHSTADPIDPIHASIRYALAFYHLDWVRSAGSAEMQSARANILACNGTVVGDGKHRPGFEFWINPYWYNDTFLLQHVVRLTITPKKQNPLIGREYIMLGWPLDDWTFRTCPHYRQCFQACEFQETHGLMKATVSYKTKRRCVVVGDSSLRTKWESVYGPSCRVFNCQYCLTDSRIHINLVEGKVVVHIHVWKNLGNAKDAFDVRWLAALRPEGAICKRSREERNDSTARIAVHEAMNEEKKAWCLDG